MFPQFHFPSLVRGEALKGTLVTEWAELTEGVIATQPCVRRALHRMDTPLKVTVKPSHRYYEALFAALTDEGSTLGSEHVEKFRLQRLDDEANKLARDGIETLSKGSSRARAILDRINGLK